MKDNEFVMAIRPEYVAAIEAGTKTLEIRRTVPENWLLVSKEEPISVWVYESKDGRKGRGAVVGMFKCCAIWDFDARRAPNGIENQAAVPLWWLSMYQGKRGHLYAWEITEYKKLEEPMPLSAVGCKRAPQNWCRKKDIK